jgi:hypothetical protein
MVTSFVCEMLVKFFGAAVLKRVIKSEIAIFNIRKMAKRIEGIVSPRGIGIHVAFVASTTFRTIVSG